jgi:hypothetical protein
MLLNIEQPNYTELLYVYVVGIIINNYFEVVLEQAMLPSQVVLVAVPPVVVLARLLHSA